MTCVFSWHLCHAWYLPVVCGVGSNAGIDHVKLHLVHSIFKWVCNGLLTSIWMGLRASLRSHTTAMCLCIICGSACLWKYFKSKEHCQILNLVQCHITMLLIMFSDTANGTHIVSDIRWVSVHVLTTDLKSSVIVISEPTYHETVVSPSVISLFP